MTRLEWYPPEGDMLAFLTGLREPVRLIAMDGLGPIDASHVQIKGPGQTGYTIIDSTIGGRVVTVQAILAADDNDSLWALRLQVAQAIAVQPVRYGESREQGRLVLYRDGYPVREIPALPRSSHVPSPRNGVGILPIDIEFECQMPWWRDIADTSLQFSQAGGFQWPIQFSIEITSNNIQQEIVNDGTVDSPVIVRLYGDVVGPRIKNLTTGETLQITGAVAAGDYVEINTEFGHKTVEYVTGGVHTSIMDRLDLSAADFWSLRPGTNLVKFEADVNTSGHAELIWRHRYGGL